MINALASNTWLKPCAANAPSATQKNPLKAARVMIICFSFKFSLKVKANIPAAISGPTGNAAKERYADNRTNHKPCNENGLICH